MKNPGMEPVDGGGEQRLWPAAVLSRGVVMAARQQAEGAALVQWRRRQAPALPRAADATELPGSEESDS
jgi:hypothetical protein